MHETSQPEHLVGKFEKPFDIFQELRDMQERGETLDDMQPLEAYDRVRAAMDAITSDLEKAGSIEERELVFNGIPARAEVMAIPEAAGLRDAFLELAEYGAATNFTLPTVAGQTVKSIQEASEKYREEDGRG